MQNFIVLRCLVMEEIAEQIKSEHTQAVLYNKGLHVKEYALDIINRTCDEDEKHNYVLVRDVSDMVFYDLLSNNMLSASTLQPIKLPFLLFLLLSVQFLIYPFC